MVQKVPFSQTSGNTVTLGTGASRVVMGADSGNLKIQDSQSNTSVIEAGLGVQGAGSGVVVVANNASLPLTGSDISAGALAWSTANSTLFVSNGTGWYKITTVNQSPTITLSVASVLLGATGNQVDVTYTTTEPEGTPVTVTVSNSGIADTNTATFTHTAANNTIRIINTKSGEGTWSGTMTATVSDGVNTAADSVTMEVIYDTTIARSESTVILPRVIANSGNEKGDVTDQSASPLTITETGDVSQGSFNPYYGNYSTSFTHKKGKSGLDTGTHTGYADFGFNNGAGSIAYNSIGVRGTSALVFGSSNWCWELWVHRITHHDETHTIDICGFAGGGAHKISYRASGDRRLTMTMGGINSGNALNVTNVELPLYRWVHLAAVRNGNAFTFYMDGKITYNSTSTFSSANPTDITTGNGSAILGYAGTGTYGNNNNNKFDYYYGGSIGHNVSHTSQKYYFAGYIGDQRIVIGSPVYTGQFTPPSATLTAVGGTYPSTTNVDTSITSGHTKLLLAGGHFRDLSSQTSPNGVSLAGNYKSVGYYSGHFRKVPFGPYKNSPFTQVTNQSGSAYFDGTGDKLTFTGIQLAGESYWTIEFWAYANPSGVTMDHSTSPMTIIEGVADSSTATNNLIIGFNRDSGNYRTQYSSRNATFQAENSTCAPDFWQHIAVVNNNGDYAMYINGIKCSTTDSNPSSPAAQGCTNTSGTWVIGGTNDTSNGFYMYKGYLSDVRFVVGTAVYTGNFFPPTGPLTATGGTYGNGGTNVNNSITSGHTKLLLNFKDSNLLDEGSNVNYKSSGSVGSTTQQKNSIPSLEFNTVGDHLTTPVHTSYQKWSPQDNFLGYAPTPFTVECWVYLSSFDTSNLPFIWSAHDSSGSPELSFDTSRNPTWKWGGSVRMTSSVAVALATWTHIAVTRDHGTTKMYINGVKSGSVADTTQYEVHAGGSYADIWYLGAQRENTAKRLNGYVSQFRITQGRKLYPFFPTFKPFTTTTSFQNGIEVGNDGADTKLIALHTSTLTTDGSGTGKTISTSGSGINANGLWGPPTGYAVYTDSGNHVEVASHADFGFGTGDFTVECYFLSAAVTQMTVLDMGSSSGWAPRIRLNSSGIIEYQANGQKRIESSQSCYIATPNAGAKFVHVAISRVSGVTRLFVDGRHEGSDFTDTNTYVAGKVWLGRTSGGSEIFYGYVTNVRIIKGTGLYTGNFTPQTTVLKA